MKIKKFKMITILMAAALCLTLFSACSSSKPDNNNTVDNSTDSSDNNDSTGLTAANIGSFTTQDLDGESYTESIFKDHDLTMVNVFTTWCTPCVEEMPYLEELSNSMKDKNVQIVGVPLDVLDENGNVDEEMLDRAKLLAEQTGVTYPLLLPDSGYMNGMLMGVEAVPYTFFVDKDGNILGDSYGSNDLEGWTSVVEDYLNITKGN